MKELKKRKRKLTYVGLQFKKIHCIFLFLCVLLLSFSCSKDDEDCLENNITIPKGTVVADINGVTTTFTVNTEARIDTIPWSFIANAVKITIKGKQEGKNAEHILLWFFASPAQEILPGTYPNKASRLVPFLEYNYKWQNQLYNYATNRSVDDFYSGSATIYQIGSEIKGTFNGNPSIGRGADGDEQPPFFHKITNGQFYLDLKK